MTTKGDIFVSSFLLAKKGKHNKTLLLLALLMVSHIDRVMAEYEAKVAVKCDKGDEPTKQGLLPTMLAMDLIGKREAALLPISNKKLRFNKLNFLN